MSNRATIQSGDLLIWSRDKRSTISNIYLNLIRFFTRSEFAHVAIAWRLEGRLYIVEATMPVVRLTPVWDDDSFYHVPMGVTWTKEGEDFLLDKIGMMYSLVDAIRGYLGLTITKDTHWQCAELCNYFYRLLGLDLHDAFTPSSLVEMVVEAYDKPIYFMPAILPPPNASTVGVT